MPCVKPDGSLTEVAVRALGILAGGEAAQALAVAKALGKPLFIARGILRELGEAGLVTAEGEEVEGSPATALFRITPAGEVAREQEKVGN